MTTVPDPTYSKRATPRAGALFGSSRTIGLETRDLIDALARDTRPRGRHRLALVTAAAVAVAFAIAAVTVALALGLRSDLADAVLRPEVAAKIAFAAAAAAVSALVLLRVSRPGGRLADGFVWLMLPFAVMAILAAAELAGAPAGERDAMVFGSSWRECLTTIPPVALVPLAVVVVALRDAAPTDLRGAGLAAGLLAGSLATVAYGLHCPEDAMPFVAAWYGGAILIVGAIGAVAVPPLLRW